MIASHYPPANYWFNFKTPICSWSDCILNKKPEPCCEHIWQGLYGFHCPASPSAAAAAAPGGCEGVLPTRPSARLAAVSITMRTALQHNAPFNQRTPQSSQTSLSNFKAFSILLCPKVSHISLFPLAASHPVVKGKPFGLVLQGCFSD